jgi:hypothetical protein
MNSRPRDLGALVAALAWAVGTWAALGTVALTGDSTTSRLGLLPPIWLLFALAVVAGGAVSALRLGAPAAAPLWLALVALLPWLPGPIPAAFMLFDGPLGWLVCLAPVIVLAMQAGRGRWAQLLGAPIRTQLGIAGVCAACLYAAAAWRVAPVIPGGDEPHYLIITQSLLTDGDLRIENNHARRDYLSYVQADLKPDYLRRGRDGAIYSIHAPGLAVLVLPAFALGSYVGVTSFLVLISAAGSVLAWRAAYRLTGDAGSAWIGWAAVALSIPFFFQAFTIYPDGPAALLVLVVVAALVERDRPGRAQLLWSGAALAALPWLHTRYAALAAALGLVLSARCVWPAGYVEGGAASRGTGRWSDVLLLLAIPALSAVAWLGFFKSIYGTFDPRAPYGGATDQHLSRVPVGLTGLLLDQQFGLLPTAPIYLLACAGLPALIRLHRRAAIELAVAILPYVIAIAGFHMWWAGHSSPARFLVPVLLPCALPIACWWARHPTRTPRAAALVLLAVSIATTVVLAWHDRGALLYNVRDGYALSLDWLAPAVNLAHALPSLFQTGVAGAWGRASGWVVALIAAWWLLRAFESRLSTPGRWALGVGLIGCLTLLIGATCGWASSGRGSIERGASMLRFAAEACGASGPRVPIGESTVGLIVPDGGRRAATAQGPLWSGRDLPPGRYTAMLRTGLNATGVLSVALGRPDSVITTCEFADAQPGRSQCAVDLPAGAASLWLTPDAALRRTVAAVDLELEPIASHEGCDRRAGRAVVSPAGALFVTGGDVYAEATGAWVIAGSTGEFVVRSSDEPLRLYLRNGSSPNTVSLSSGDWHDLLSFAPNQSREAVVPHRSDAPGATSLTISPSGGFRPADTDPASRDVRMLGVWVELR